jgi:hypothetical protein
VQRLLHGTAGCSFNIIDAGRVKREGEPFGTVNDFALGLGVFGMAGVEVPLGSRVALFAEGRVSADFQLTESKDVPGGIDVANLGGYAGIAGLQVSF